MSIVVSCTCGKQFQAQPHLAGKTLRCPNCQQMLTIPAASGAAPARPQQPAPQQPAPQQPPAQQPATQPGFGADAGWSAPAQQPTAPQFGTPGAAPAFGQPAQPAKRRGLSKVWIIGGIVAAVVILPIVVCCGGVAMLLRTPALPKEALEPFELASIPVPGFPDRGPAIALGNGVNMYRVRIGNGSGFGSPAGHNSEMYLYLPATIAEGSKLPCILIAGAGTPMFHGMKIGEADRPEHLPYVQAGFAVVAYDLDGPLDPQQADNDQQMARSYQAFSAARAGVVNGRNALEYVRAKVPEVDSNKIYSAGHSSAGTASLLLAAHEPRLAGAIAYAPCYDIPERMTGAGVGLLALILKNFRAFAVQSSPKTHEARIKCPVFLFHAEDDSNVPASASKAAHQRLQGAGVDSTLVTVPTGEHYQSMIDAGIPAGIKWLESKGAK